MSFRRPAAVPRWAWGAGATLVQPPSGSAEAGFSTAQRPPAQWFNWQLNAVGAWIDFLRGPDVERWTRSEWGAAITGATAIPFAFESATSDAGQTASAFRFAVVGKPTGFAARVYASQTGTAWTQRTNLPASITDPFALNTFGGWWLLGALTSAGVAQIYRTAADDGTGVGAIGSAGGSWTASTMPATPTEVKAFARLGSGNVVAACATRAVYSTDLGATWADASFATTPTGNGRDVVATGSKLVWVSQDGEIFTSGDGASFTQTTSLAPGAGTWQLTAGDAATGTGEVVAWRSGQSTAVDLFRSTDGGTSFSAIAQTSAPSRITSLRWAEGVWVATSTRAPWAWVSNDLTSWRAVNVPVDTSTLGAALYGAVWDGGAWHLAGNGFGLSSGRASDPAGGAYVALDSPATLADAGSFRGRLLATTAPTNGQVYAWNSSTSRWEPTAAGSVSPLTTNGDLYTRAGGVDARLAIGSTGQVLSVSGGAPVWSSLPWASHTSTGTTTTNATTTTCGTYTVPTNSAVTIKLLVTAITSTYGASCGWELLATARNAAGTVTLEGGGAIVTGPTDGATAWTVAADVSGTSVRLRVTGAAATTIDWTARWIVG